MSAVNHFIKKGLRHNRIDEYLGSELGRAGYGGVDITKTPLGERITIHAARPGIVIGRRGKNIRMITDELVSRFGLENPQIEVKEVIKPELNAKVMAFSLVSAIERGVHRRRAAYSVLRRVVNSGAKGCEIIISGKLTSKRSRHEAYRMGLLAKSGEVGTEYVMRANATAVMKLGTIGVTVNIMRGDVILPDDISIHSIKFDEAGVVETISEDAPETPVEKKPKAAEPKDKDPKKAAEPAKKVEPKKAPTAKKTELDKEVEKLSDLIEKSPPKEKAAAKKTPAKKTTKKEPAKKTTTKKVEPAKPATKKTTKKAEPAKKKKTKKEEPAKKTTAKKEPAKKATAKKEPAKKAKTKKAAATKTKADKEKKKKK
ncbi:MAG: 30S ribosomal protein S3 [Candidatus Heimdallarchaeota archaeon]